MRRDLPSGTVTFLFTDVEGSTQLLHELGAEGYANALAEHRRVLRRAFAAHGGVEVDTQGDAFFVAFPTPRGAVGAAVEALEGLSPGPIRVRMGIHTGRPHLAEEGYVGVDVHRAARIAACGHGGQVLVSGATASLVAGDGLQDLGEHRLKDFDEAVSLYQLGDASFPPLKTISNTNLPRPASSFVGRQKEVAEVASLLEDGARLLTLTGPGGSGKTRLAIEAAAELVPEFKAGVFWVGLAPLRDHALVADTIAKALGAKDGLAEHIGERELLLLLDNLEQVVEAAPELAALVEACPNLRLLVTSREPLRVRGEVEYRVLPLAEREAVELFCARARTQPDAAVEELCRALDNLPLALELAAARTSVLSPAQILERLSGRLDLLKGGRDADPRQQTLRAAIEWSHDLCSAQEQVLFRRLSVFLGGCTFEAAERVAGAEVDTLQSVVEKSLVNRTGERFWMLETIRDYAVERLDDSGEGSDVRRRHAEFVLALAESANLSAEAEGPQRHDLVIPEHNNARAAIEWAASAGDPELALRIAVALQNFWVTHDPFEGVHLFDRLLARERAVPPALLARALCAHGDSTFATGDHRRAAGLYEESLDAFRKLGDERGVALLTFRLGLNAVRLGDTAKARPLLEASLEDFRRIGFRRGETQVLGSLGSLERADGNTERAAVLFEASADMAAEIGRLWWQAGMLANLAELALEAGRFGEAAARAREQLALAGRIGDRQTTVLALAHLARVAAEDGDALRAGRLWGAVEAEEERAPIGAWEGQRENFAAWLDAHAGPELDQGLAEGRRLSLDAAITEALAGATPQEGQSPAAS